MTAKEWFDALQWIHIVLILAILLLFAGYIYLLVKNTQLEVVHRIVGKWKIRVFGILFGLLVVIYLIYNLYNITPNGWVEISLLAGLVAVTCVYALHTAIQSEASREMAKEMREQRVTASRPVIIQKAVYKESDLTDETMQWSGFERSAWSHFSHFEVYNAGNGPAIEAEIFLLPKEGKGAISPLRETFLRAGEPPIKFYPSNLANLPNPTTYYLVCEYQSISLIPKQRWYQTRLPFELEKSPVVEDEMYVIPGDLKFEEVPEKERIDAFKGSKPK